MEKKGLRLSILCISVVLFLMILAQFSFADACYDPAFGSCIDLDATGCEGISGTFYSGQTISQVAACQLSGCCCYSGTSTGGVATVSATSCSRLYSGATFWPVSGSGLNEDGVCNAYCNQPGATTLPQGSGSSGTGTGGTDTGSGSTGTDTTTNTDTTNNQPTQSLDDCKSTISGTVTSTYGIPSGLLVYTQNSRSSSWAIVGTNGAFTINNVCDGDNTIKATDVSGQFTSSSVTKTVGKNAVVSGVTLTLLPINVGTISGTVVAASNPATKISNAFVRVQGTQYSALTNGQGEFTLNIPNVGNANVVNYNLLTSVGRDTTSNYVSATTPVKLYTTTTPKLTASGIVINLSSQTCFGTTAPTTLSYVLTKGKSEVTLSWTMTACSEQVYNYVILRCDDQASKCTADDQYLPVGYVDGTSAKSFVDNLIWERNYTYRVGANFAGYNSAISTQKLQIYSGDSACDGILTTNSFCGTGKSTVSPFATIGATQVCDEQNKFKSTICGATTPLCVERIGDATNLVAQCIAPNPCQQNTYDNPFGLYFSQSTCTQQQGGGVCYFDSATSNVNSCLNCKQDMTCSDYKSQSACTNDANSCGVRNCEWDSIDSLLGIGVCKSTKKSSCDVCSDPSKSPFGICDANTCAALGSDTDGCFYSQTQSANTCQSCAQTACSDYTSATSCQGASGTSTSLNSATNAFLSTSADACQMQVCRWFNQPGSVNGGVCVKDADANGADSGATATTANDCAGNIAIDSVKCNLDRTPPTTFIIMPQSSNPFVNNVSIRFIPQDVGASGAYQVLATKFCIAAADKLDSECNVAKDFALAQQAGVNGVFVNITGGQVNRAANPIANSPAYSYLLDSTPGIHNYVLKYYSIDLANNVEVVKTKEFTIDTTPPQIVLAVTLFPVSSPTPTQTDIVASVESQVPVRCAFSVVPLANVVYAPDEFSTSTPKTYSLFYESVFRRADGPYAVKATCRSVTGNVAYDVKEIVTGADTRIKNVMPTGLIDSTSPTLSLQTTQPVLCRATNDPNKLNGPSGVKAAFDALEYNFTMNPTPTNNLYTHTLATSNLPEGPHNYYVMCDFNPYGTQIISFTVNTQPAVIKFQKADGSNFDFSAWQQDPALYVSCSNSGLSKQPCAAVEYCKVPARFGSGLLATTTCEPTIALTPITTNTFARIPLDNNDRSTVVCARAKEAFGTTDRTGATVCNSVLIDKVVPMLMSDALPTVSNTNSISLSGSVFDPVVSNLAVTFPPTAGSATAAYFGGRVVASNLFMNGTLNLVSTTSQPSYLDIILANGSASPIAVRIDMTDTNSNQFELIFLQGGQQIGTPQTIPIKSGVVTNWNLTLDGTTLSASVAGVSSTVQLSSSSHTGDIVFKAYNNGGGNNNKPQITLASVSMVDLDLSRNYPLNLVVKVDGGLDDRSSQAQISAIGSYDKNVILDNSDTLTEDRSYSIAVTVKDMSNLESNAKIGSIVFSTAGPRINSISFVPENLSQKNKTYIEFRQNATTNIATTSLYALSNAYVDVLSNKQQITTLVPSGFSGRYNVLGLPTGLLDVNVEVTNVAGTSTIKSFAKALLIKNTLDPSRNISLPDEITTNTTTPTLTFSVVDDSVISCNANYKNNVGLVKVDTFTSTGTNSQTLTLSSPLSSVVGEITESWVVVTCSFISNPSDSWSHLVRIYVDNRPPVIAVKSPIISGVGLMSYDRFVKNYISYLPGQRTLQISADKPVVCKVGQVNSIDTQTQNGVNFFNSLGEDILVNGERKFSNIVSVPVSVTDKSNTKYAVSCIDESGNVALVSRFVTFDVDTQGAPYILSVSPSSTSKSLSTQINVTTVVGATCTLQTATLSSDGKESSPSAILPMSAITSSISNGFTYTRNVNFANDGMYRLLVSCSLNGKTTTKSADLIVDSVIPQVNFSQELNPVTYTQTPFATFGVTTSEPVSLTVTDNVGPIYTKVISKGDSSISIPTSVGFTDVTLTFSDVVGNSVTYQTQLRRAAIGYKSEFVDLLAHSTRSSIYTAVAKVALSGASGSTSISSEAIVSAQLIKVNSDLSQSTPLVLESTLISTSTGGLVTINLPRVLADGVYDLVYSINLDGEVIAADSAVFTIDTLAESIDTQLPFNLSQRNLHDVIVNLSVPYANLISSELSSWNSQNNVVLRNYEKVRGELQVPPQYSSMFAYSVTNELGHVSSVSAKVIHDVALASPAVTVVLDTQSTTYSGSVPQSYSPIPMFTLNYKEPMRLISAQIKKSGSSTATDLVALDSQPNQFYNSLQLRSLSSLTNGQYALIFTVADSSGNIVSNQQYDFKVQASGLQITLVSPKFGLTSTNELKLVIGTDRPATCGYALSGTAQTSQFSTMNSFSATDGFRHNVTLAANGADSTSNYLISCIEVGTTTPIVNKTITLGKKTVAPKITSLSVPTVYNGILSNPHGDGTLVAVTDIPTVCKYTDGTGITYASMNAFDNKDELLLTNSQDFKSLSDGQSYTYTVICDNGAGVLSSPETVSFKVDGSKTGLILINSPKDGGAYSVTSLPIQFSVARPAEQGCVWSRTLAGISTANTVSQVSSDKLNYNISPIPFPVGQNEIHIQCMFSSSSSLIQPEYVKSRFVVDTTAPAKGSVIVANVTTSTQRINAEFVFDDEESGITLYEYAVGTSAYPTSGWNNTKNITATSAKRVSIVKMDIVDGKTYYVTARATNKAGLKSDWVSSNGTRVDLSALRINDDFVPPLTTTVTLATGGVVTYPSNVKLTLPNSTQITVETELADKLKPGLSVTLTNGATVTFVNKSQVQVPSNSRILVNALPSVVDVPVVPKTTTNTSKTNTKNQTTSRNSSTNVDQEPLDYPSAFGAGAWIFIISLILVGGGAGYYFYARKQHQTRANGNAIGAISGPSRSRSDVVEEVFVPRGPMTVNDKLKLALQSRIRKQRGEALPGKTSKLFSAFDNDKASESLKKFSSIEPKIGVSKINAQGGFDSTLDKTSNDTSVKSNDGEESKESNSPSTTLKSENESKKIELDSDKSSTIIDNVKKTESISKSQESLDKLKKIASKQKPITQLKKLQRRPKSEAGPALKKLRSLKKK